LPFHIIQLAHLGILLLTILPVQRGAAGEGRSNRHSKRCRKAVLRRNIMPSRSLRPTAYNEPRLGSKSAGSGSQFSRDTPFRQMVRQNWQNLHFPREIDPLPPIHPVGGEGWQGEKTLDVRAL